MNVQIYTHTTHRQADSSFVQTSYTVSELGVAENKCKWHYTEVAVFDRGPTSESTRKTLEKKSLVMRRRLLSHSPVMAAAAVFYPS